MMIRRILAACIVIAYGVGSVHGNDLRPDDQDVQEVSSWIEGSYSSEKQSRSDSSFANQRLEVRRIWMDRTDGVWFVMERFQADSSTSPLQQRVIHIHGVEENLTEMRVFAWKNPSKTIGLWKNTDGASQFSDSDLRVLRGCEMYLQRDATSFFGGTHGMACSSIPGMSYTSITVRIADQGLAFWERGYSADNKQIFGSEKGPYYYLKQKP